MAFVRPFHVAGRRFALGEWESGLLFTPLGEQCEPVTDSISSRRFGLVLAAGVGITLLTGLIPLRTLLGGTHYGIPVVWLVRRVLAPEYFPWRVNWIGFVVDVVVWTVVVLAALVIYDWFR